MPGERRNWTVTKFGRHPDGYWHARITVDGQSFYVHCRFGSWMVPGETGGVLRELLSPYKEVLAEQAKRIEARVRRERDQQEAIAVAAKAANKAVQDASAAQQA